MSFNRASGLSVSQYDKLCLPWPLPCKPFRRNHSARQRSITSFLLCEPLLWWWLLRAPHTVSLSNNNADVHITHSLPPSPSPHPPWRSVPTLITPPDAAPTELLMNAFFVLSGETQHINCLKCRHDKTAWLPGPLHDWLADYMTGWLSDWPDVFLIALTRMLSDWSTAGVTGLRCALYFRHLWA